MAMMNVNLFSESLGHSMDVTVVLPGVHESCFVDMNIGNCYGTYVAKELPEMIWSMFSCISDRREDNYVSGLSNGGYGCLHSALKHPEYQYTYDEISEYGHEWTFWDIELRKFLDFVGLVD